MERAVRGGRQAVKENLPPLKVPSGAAPGTDSRATLGPRGSGSVPVASSAVGEHLGEVNLDSKVALSSARPLFGKYSGYSPARDMVLFSESLLCAFLRLPGLFRKSFYLIWVVQPWSLAQKRLRSLQLY